jgi:FAD/FMN-containing dehydrogenase
MENTGHINKQRVAGAISTGTHGAGKHLKNLSGQVYGVRLVSGTGDIREFNENNDPQMMQALKVSLGALGIFTHITLKVLPAFRLRRTQYCARLDECLEALDQMMDENRNFCFYWYPRRDDVSIRTWNFETEASKRLPFGKVYKEYTGWGKDVLPSVQTLKYNELEYSVDAAVAADCFMAIRQRILEKYRKLVAWRVLFRPVAADDVMLSNAYKRDTVAITVHQNATLPYREYFDDIEGIFQQFEGRPHWGKKHSMQAKDLEQLYPEWENFQSIRREMDPGDIFLNDYLKRVFVYDHSQ